MSEGEFIESDRNMTDRDSGTYRSNEEMGFQDEQPEEQEEQFADEQGENDLVDEFGEDFGDMEMDSARQAEMMAATEMIEEGLFEGESTPRTDLMDEAHTQVEQKEQVKSEPQQPGEPQVESNIDVKLVRSLWPYFNYDDPVPTESTLRSSKGTGVVKHIIGQMEEAIVKNDKDLETLKEKYPNIVE